jgi:Velvet factor
MAQILRDESDIEGIFFLFHETSVRTSGVYRLRFTLYDLGILNE